MTDGQDFTPCACARGNNYYLVESSFNPQFESPLLEALVLRYVRKKKTKKNNNSTTVHELILASYILLPKSRSI